VALTSPPAWIRTLTASCIGSERRPADLKELSVFRSLVYLALRCLLQLVLLRPAVGGLQGA
jgi:hypothetical protein